MQGSTPKSFHSGVSIHPELTTARLLFNIFLYTKRAFTVAGKKYHNVPNVQRQYIYIISGNQRVTSESIDIGKCRGDGSVTSQ